MRASTLGVALVGFLVGAAASFLAVALLGDGPQASGLLARAPSSEIRALRPGDPRESAELEPGDEPGPNHVAREPERAREQDVGEERAAVSVEPELSYDPEAPLVGLDSTILELMEKYPDAFTDMLVNKLIEDGDPGRALALLKANDSKDVDHYNEVAAALRESGDVAGAVDAYTTAARLDPMEYDHLRPLMELDPSAALVCIQDSLAWQPPPGNPGMRVRLAEAMAAAGQDEEARALVAELREAKVGDNNLTLLYQKLEPEKAEAELREQLESTTKKNNKLSVMRRLERMMRESGRTEEALAVVQEMLELDPNNSAARRLLMKADPEAAIGLLEERTALAPKNATLWNDLGNTLIEQDRKVDAIKAWEQAVMLNGSTSAVKQLLEHSPDTVWPLLENHTMASKNDEKWGDLGDLYYRNGHLDDAKRAWETAWELDSNDYEWYGKLQALQVGRDPFN